MVPPPINDLSLNLMLIPSQSVLVANREDPMLLEAFTMTNHIIMVYNNMNSSAPFAIITEQDPNLMDSRPQSNLPEDLLTEQRMGTKVTSPTATVGTEKLIVSGDLGESSSSCELSAPPGFPYPAFLQRNEYISEEDNLRFSALSIDDRIDTVKVDDILGKEGAEVWNKHFAPSNKEQATIQVPVEWVNFLSVTFLHLINLTGQRSLLPQQSGRLLLKEPVLLPCHLLFLNLVLLWIHPCPSLIWHRTLRSKKSTHQLQLLLCWPRLLHLLLICITSRKERKRFLWWRLG